MKTRKNVVRLNESQLQRIIKESMKNILKEYAGYDSEKKAYGEQGSYPLHKHIDRVGRADGHTRTDAERKVGEIRQERNGQNLDKLRSRNTYNPYKNYLSNVKNANDMKRKAMDNLKDEIHEGKINRIIKESVKKVLMEGGHLYWKDEKRNSSH